MTGQITLRSAFIGEGLGKVEDTCYLLYPNLKAMYPVHFFSVLQSFETAVESRLSVDGTGMRSNVDRGRRHPQHRGEENVVMLVGVFWFRLKGQTDSCTDFALFFEWRVMSLLGALSFGFGLNGVWWV